MPSKMRPFVTDTSRLLHEAFKSGKRILFEAAQGSLLDVDHGTYPVCDQLEQLAVGRSGAGRACRRGTSTAIIGVMKAYTTRVGRGPFPTELKDGPTGSASASARSAASTAPSPAGRGAVGWFDAVAVRYTAALDRGRRDCHHAARRAQRPAGIDALHRV